MKPTSFVRSSGVPRRFGVGAFSLAVMLSGTALAADQELLDILLKNGSITQDQYDALGKRAGPDQAGPGLLEVLQKNGAITQDQYQSLSKKPSAAAKTEDKDAAHVRIGEKGLEVESADGNFKWRFGGRIQADSQVNWNDDSGPNGTDLANGVGFRRARIYTEGAFFKDYEYRIEYDFARNNGGSQGITDAFVKYVHFKPFAITIGQMNEGKSMESVMSNNYLTFIERSLPNNAFMEQGANSKYQLGLMAETYDRLFDLPYTVRGGITTESVGAPGPGNSSDNAQGTVNNPGGTNANGSNINRNAFSGNTSYQLVGRGTFLPFKDGDGNLVHTGVWGSWRELNNNYNQDGTLRTGGWAYQSQPDTNVDRTNWANTGNLTSTVCTHTNASGVCTASAIKREANNIAMFGAELAGVFGPTHVEAEYMQAQIAGKGYSNNDLLEGFYVSGGWFLTGETRPYDEKRGTWNRLVPNKNFLFSDGWGAWEVAARYDLLDMNTRNIHGGSLDIFTLGLNWYLTPRVRLMSDWVRVFSTNTGSASTKCAFPNQGSNATISCFNGLSPNVWETAVRIDF